MRAPLTGAVAALALAVLAVLAPPSIAQEVPTPTASPSPSPTASPTPSPTPTPEEQERAERDRRDRRAKTVRAIYRDFERDGRIDDCDHSEAALKRARRSISDSYADDSPDFRNALIAAIERHESGRCEEQQQQREDANSDPTPTPTASATPAPSGGGGGSSTPAPSPTVPPATSPDSGALPDFGSGGSGGTGGSGGDGGGIGDIDPLPEPGEDAIPEGTPSPTPAPAATPAPPPKLIVTRASADPHLFVPGTLLAIALVGLALAALSALAAKRTGRLEGLDHAWQEAAWRTSGTWSDFTDWLRSGR